MISNHLEGEISSLINHRVFSKGYVSAFERANSVGMIKKCNYPSSSATEDVMTDILLCHLKLIISFAKAPRTTCTSCGLGLPKHRLQESVRPSILTYIDKPRLDASFNRHPLAVSVLL